MPLIKKPFANNGMFFTLFFSMQVGEDDQKLAEGISLFSIASENREKPAVLGELIKVKMDWICIFFVPLQLKSFPRGIKLLLNLIARIHW